MGFLIKCLLGRLEASRRLSLLGLVYGEGGGLVCWVWMKQMMGGDVGLGGSLLVRFFVCRGAFPLKRNCVYGCFDLVWL